MEFCPTCGALRTCARCTECDFPFDGRNFALTEEEKHFASLAKLSFGVLTEYGGNDKYLELPHGITVIGNRAFLCGSLREISIPDTVFSIGESAFAGNMRLREIHIPDSVTEIGKGAFSDCWSLQRATLSSALTEIPDRLFEECQELTEIRIPERVTYIGIGSFEGCRSLKKVHLPPSLAVIDKNAFAGASRLKTVTVPMDCIMDAGAFPEDCKIIRTTT